MGHDGFTLLVGTFRAPEIYTIVFKPSGHLNESPSLTVSKKSTAAAGHSWLALSRDKTRLYTTCWAQPPSVASYRVLEDGSAELLNQKEIRALSGYVAVTDRHLYSAGGPSGEVFLLDGEDGSIGDLVQEVSFRRAEELDDGKRDGVAHGSFGGLRHGAHSADLSPDGRSLYVADIGHNCIWAYSVDESERGRPPLAPGAKHASPRPHDGPRHTWPHPGGGVLYCVQEHSSMVDAFGVAEDGVALEHLHGYTILPEGRSADDFWADEVRLSNKHNINDKTNTSQAGRRPRYLYASTRGLQPETKGYVAAYELNGDGTIAGPAVDIFETRTSGGLANAIEPAPASASGEEGEEDFIAITDSEQGYVSILGFDGRRFREVAVTKLEGENGEVVQAATAVWL
ncbi:hypothetical protein VPNG_05955 [Cytospora leucostoma]|uniref:Muconate cycloisomerase 1 n=1 Tax=Cytospora leucostoma TaxID=1230097 RepID=A0A423XAT7_9PEZI|nr:hypothetical protein VPNG_05955 [Cytospora leucostoma]